MENNNTYVDEMINDVTPGKKIVRCNEKCECYSRICGFFRPVENFNKGKKQEFEDRHFYES